MWAVHDNKPRLVSFLLSMGADPSGGSKTRASLTSGLGSVLPLLRVPEDDGSII